MDCISHLLFLYDCIKLQPTWSLDKTRYEVSDILDLICFHNCVIIGILMDSYRPRITSNLGQGHFFERAQIHWKGHKSILRGTKANVESARKITSRRCFQGGGGGGGDMCAQGRIQDFLGGGGHKSQRLSQPLNKRGGGGGKRTLFFVFWSRNLKIWHFVPVGVGGGVRSPFLDQPLA